jgi:hypothetical protein
LPGVVIADEAEGGGFDLDRPGGDGVRGLGAVGSIGGERPRGLILGGRGRGKEGERGEDGEKRMVGEHAKISHG